MNKENNTEYNELFQEIEDSLLPKIGRRRIRVLVFGPDLNDGKSSAKLRKYIINKCKEDDYTTVLAEHEEIKQLYEKILGSANDLCKIEYHLALGRDKNDGREFIDGIVIIPDSAGSFIELGMFALEDLAYDKILVLFNKDFGSDILSNFVGLGAKSAYDNGKARTRVLDYKNKKLVWDEVSGFLKSRRDKKVWRTWKRAK